MRCVVDLKVGEIFGWPVYKTWEFTSSLPVRSVFPLWLVYGAPLTVLKWIADGLGYDDVSPMAVFYVLRTTMFLLSFVLEDWALQELLPTANERELGLLLVTSSYVTWTYQMHTFSNSIETIVVLWCLVLINRLRDTRDRTLVRSSVGLAFLGVLGVFNRITFPAWLVVGAVQLLPALFDKPLRLPIMLAAGLLTALIAVAMDTEHYTGQRLRLLRLTESAVLTPWNNLVYNLDTSNLAQHGLHPYWQHFVANLPQLLGPAIPLLFVSCRRSALFWSGISGTAVLSCFRHQEARFLLPAVPLFLASVQLPQRFRREWVYAWIIFNVLAGVLFGFYHQAGVVPVQTWISQQHNISHVLWWKTYSPPRWLLGTRNADITTTDLMGMPGSEMIDRLTAISGCEGTLNSTLLVAPSSATFLDSYLTMPSLDQPVRLKNRMHYSRHIGLDDLDFGDDGVWPTLQRVVGRRGLIVYEASKVC